MGFVFRLVFWLGVAFAIMPSEERPGQAFAGEAGGSVEERFQTTLSTVWTFASDIVTACQSNPDLCAATQALAQTTADTGQLLAHQLQAGAAAGPAPEPAPVSPDGRVAKFSGRAD
jgi:hypothetical protein